MRHSPVLRLALALVVLCSCVSDSKPEESPDAQDFSKAVFMTRTEYNGNLGGLDGADERCQSAAADVPGAWIAWLSTSEVLR